LVRHGERMRMKVHTVLRFENLNERHYSEIGWEGVGWVHLAQDRDQWWALVNMVMKLHSLPSSSEFKECVELYLQSPNTSSWRDALLKHRDNFTFYITKLRFA